MKIEFDLPEPYVYSLKKFADENLLETYSAAALSALIDHLIERYDIED